MNSNYDRLKRMCNALLSLEEDSISEERFIAILEGTRNKYPEFPITDSEFDFLKKELLSIYNITMANGVVLKDKTIHKSWVPNRRAEIEPYFWNRYDKYLKENKGWSASLVNRLSTVAEDILDLCGDPQSEEFSIKGLVLGEVQSGKTANYTAICNKAIDYGYKVIIVLAGMQDNLRQQTQSRLELELVGKASNSVNSNATKYSKPIGVGVHSSPSKEIAFFTSVENDFSKKASDVINLSLDLIKSPVLLVVKKNKTVLNNLINWILHKNKLNENNQLEYPLLLIDDEADNASINTRDFDEDPTTINKAIREILHIFKKSTYLAITATPFANIFIDSENEDDLFPSDFIYALSAPSNYIGANLFFNDNLDVSRYVVPIDSDVINEDFKLKHKINYIPTILPDSLKEALNYFILANAIRDFRGDISSHRSMLVHMSRFTDVQNHLCNLVIDWLTQIKNDLQAYAKQSYWDKIDSIKSLHDTWIKYNLSSISTDWNTILKEYLYKSAAPIDVKAINMASSASKLNYNAAPNGLRIIAIGGNSLSRGLTLEGLTVSYFLRDSKMYDTLLQMARWFGYRTGYEDLVKVWMTSELNAAFHLITRNTRELRAEIIKMSNANMTPREYRLRVREDPGSLIVTARNKMRCSESMEADISVSGRLIESHTLDKDLEILEHNRHLFLSFIDRLATIGKPLKEPELTQTNYYWTDVSPVDVANFVSNFSSYKWNLSFETSSLADFISSTEWPNGWDVVLMNHGTGDSILDLKYGNSILPIAKTQRRKINIGLDTISFSKSSIGSGECTKVGLSKAQIEMAQNIHRNDYQTESYTSRTYLTETRPPLLMMHIIEADYRQQGNLPNYLYVIGLGFPQSSLTEQRVKYRINLVNLKKDNTDDEEDI